MFSILFPHVALTDLCSFNGHTHYTVKKGLLFSIPAYFLIFPAPLTPFLTLSYNSSHLPLLFLPITSLWILTLFCTHTFQSFLAQSLSFFSSLVTLRGATLSLSLSTIFFFFRNSLVFFKSLHRFFSSAVKRRGPHFFDVVLLSPQGSLQLSLSLSSLCVTYIIRACPL